MEIVRANESDAEEICELQRAAFQTEAEFYNDFSIQPLTQTLEKIRKEIRDYVTLKAVEDGAIIGSVRAYEKENVCHICKVMVHPEKRRRGIARELMLAIEHEFPCVKLFALSTGSKSAGNHRFYESLGYRKKCGEYSYDPVELVAMEKPQPRKN